MPIKDLSNKKRIPRLGKIRLGVRGKNPKGTEYPTAVDYFVCPDEIKKVYGDKPKRLNIAFHSDDIAEIFPQYYKRYGQSKGLICKGDGETANCVNTDTGELEEIECTGRECDYYHDKACREIANLMFMVLGIKRMGVYQLDTSSVNTIMNVNGGMDMIKNMTGGKLSMIPCFLDVIPHEAQVKGKKRIVHVLRLEPDINKIQQALLKPVEVLAIAPSPRDENRDIEEDLHPEGFIHSIKPTPTDLKNLWTIAKEKGYDELSFKTELIASEFIKESTQELSTEDYNKVMEELRVKV